MTKFHQMHGANTFKQLWELLEEFPVGCEPDFDTDHEELDRQLAGLRLILASA